MIHIIDKHGQGYSVPDEGYDLRFDPRADLPTIHLFRSGSDPVPVWNGPAPLARPVVSALLKRISEGAAGEQINVAEIEDTIARSMPR